MPPAEPRPARTARILYLGLLAGPLLFAGVALALLSPQIPLDQPICSHAVCAGRGAVRRRADHPD